mmetsp:Transcript_20193/g.42292  ORF Transcript_20193/g.42292 Transcript_20193/m.42292 type:complete len:229 (-) Transcript_20193:1509-2195(-)
MSVNVEVYVLAWVGCIGKRDGRCPLLADDHKPLCPVVDFFLVHRPKLIPLHEGDSSGCALAQNVTTQRFNIDAPPNDTPNGGETRIIPASHLAVLNEPRQFPLTKLCVHEVHAGKTVDPDPPELEGILKPRILLIPVVVLGRPEGMRDSLDAIHDGAGEVVRGVGLVSSPRPVVGREVLPENNGVAHGSVDALHVDLSSEAPLGPLRVTGSHQIKVLAILFYGHISAL